MSRQFANLPQRNYLQILPFFGVVNKYVTPKQRPEKWWKRSNETTTRKTKKWRKTGKSGNACAVSFPAPGWLAGEKSRGCIALYSLSVLSSLELHHVFTQISDRWRIRRWVSWAIFFCIAFHFIIRHWCHVIQSRFCFDFLKFLFSLFSLSIDGLWVF